MITPSPLLYFPRVKPQVKKTCFPNVIPQVLNIKTPPCMFSSGFSSSFLFSKASTPSPPLFPKCKRKELEVKTYGPLGERGGFEACLKQ